MPLLKRKKGCFEKTNQIKRNFSKNENTKLENQKQKMENHPAGRWGDFLCFFVRGKAERLPKGRRCSGMPLVATRQRMLGAARRKGRKEEERGNAASALAQGKEKATPRGVAFSRGVSACFETLDWATSRCPEAEFAVG